VTTTFRTKNKATRCEASDIADARIAELLFFWPTTPATDLRSDLSAAEQVCHSAWHIVSQLLTSSRLQ
jgi:hypothetical protein